MEMDWVKRKAIGEQFMEEKEQIWKSLCASLEAATDSYRVHYGGAARGHSENHRHFRIHVGSRAPYQDAVIDVTFAPPLVRVVSTMSHCKTSTFSLTPSKEKPFLSGDKKPMTFDQVSEAILRCVFFPAENRNAPRPVVSPCSEAV